LPFYLDPPTKEFRFGDVVTGFQHPTVRIDAPDNAVDLKIAVTRPQYFAVMTPCCDIELKSISLAPLEKVRDSILKHPRLLKNLLLINAPFAPKDGYTPEEIEKMKPEKQAELVTLPAVYAYQDCFIYEPNGIFPEYEVKRNKQLWSNLQHRMVDFKSIFRVECSLIEREQDVPTGVKVSELTVEGRAQLRDKLTYYFGRNADEGEQ
jgi:hypothetical protein